MNHMFSGPEGGLKVVRPSLKRNRALFEQELTCLESELTHTNTHTRTHASQLFLLSCEYARVQY
jgi:hypothetical protein